VHIPQPQPQLQAKLDGLHAERLSLQCNIATTACLPALTAEQLQAMFAELAHIDNEIARIQGGSFDGKLKL
jgi:hypothetical protein